MAQITVTDAAELIEQKRRLEAEADVVAKAMGDAIAAMGEAIAAHGEGCAGAVRAERRADSLFERGEVIVEKLLLLEQQIAVALAPERAVAA